MDWVISLQMGDSGSQELSKPVATSTTKISVRKDHDYCAAPDGIIISLSSKIQFHKIFYKFQVKKLKIVNLPRLLNQKTTFLMLLKVKSTCLPLLPIMMNHTSRRMQPDSSAQILLSVPIPGRAAPAPFKTV